MNQGGGIREAWLSLWVGLAIFVLSLGGLVGADLLGWVVTTSVWTDVSKALGTASKTYAGLGGTGALIATFVALLFFAWLWGPWALVLGAPLMAVVKVCADRIEPLKPLGELIGE